MEEPEIGPDDERDGKCDKEYIGDDVGGTHGNELRKALSTLWARIWYDLPVFMEWLTFGYCRNDNSDKSDGKEDADEAEDCLVSFVPAIVKDALQEF